MLLLIPILLPLLAGAFLPLLHLKGKTLHGFIFGILLISGASLLAVILQKEPTALTLLSFGDTLSIGLQLDAIGKLFALLNGVLFLLIALFAFRYMEHEGNETFFFCFYLLAYSFSMLLDGASNLVTMYLAFELITLSTFPLVLHNRQPEALRASLKYLFYSVAGAFLALFGLLILAHYSSTLSFNFGGVLEPAAMAQHKGLLLAASFCMLVGFGAKCGLYPLHGWLPAAHPVAPGPASALLSGLIVKAGVFCCIRCLYYLVGPDFLRGTWVQLVWLILALLTVFMGSMLAYRENKLKKRLAYSTVSQISYILLGLGCLTSDGALGALLHTVVHATVKSGLFMVAAAIIFQTGATMVDELAGIGKKMPWTLTAFTLLSLALVGIPPTGGFVSKWFLALGALNAPLNALSYLIPAVLLISALLTAGYLLPIVVHGFLPGEGTKMVLPAGRSEASWQMLVPIWVTAVLSLLFGVVSGPLVQYLSALLV